MTDWRRLEIPMAALTAVIAVAGASIPFLRDWQRSLASGAVRMEQSLPAMDARRDSVERVRDSARATLVIEQARAASRADSALHLVIAVDSGTVTLMRDGIPLRTAAAQFVGGRPAVGAHRIARMITTVAQPVGPLTDSLGLPIRVRDTTQVTVQRVTLDDGTVLRAGAASEVLVERAASGARAVVVSTRDFEAMRPNLVKGMSAWVF
jgi:hypothetical protein